MHRAIRCSSLITSPHPYDGRDFAARIINELTLSNCSKIVRMLWNTIKKHRAEERMRFYSGGRPCCCWTGIRKDVVVLGFVDMCLTYDPE